MGVCGCFFPLRLSPSELRLSAHPWVVLRFFLWFLGDSPLSSTAPATVSRYPPVRSPLGYSSRLWSLVIPLWDVPLALSASSSALRCLYLSLAFHFLLQTLRLQLFFIFSCAVGWRCLQLLLLLWLMFGFRFPFGSSPFLLVASPLFPLRLLS